MQSIQPLIRRLFLNPRLDLVISTVSTTGYQVGNELYKKMAQVIYFPLDFCFCSSCAWKRINPDLTLLCDSELWPEHLHQAKKRGIAVWLVNGRISDRSFSKYGRFLKIARWLWGHISLIFPSSVEARKRIGKFLSDPSCLSHGGNLKCERSSVKPLEGINRKIWLDELGFCEEKDGELKIILGCSTWPGEEEMLIDAFENLRKKNANWRLILVPRHGERRKEIALLLQKRKIPYSLRSDGAFRGNDSHVAVVDTVGELREVIRLAAVVFLGKTLPPNGGGQSPLDGIAAGTPMVVGPNYSNFRDMITELNVRHCILVGKDRKDIWEKLKQLCENEDMRLRMSLGMRTWLSEHADIGEKIYECVTTHLKIKK
jgi:3-deoxy-D-manno-octulosonic-acid transferase